MKQSFKDLSIVLSWKAANYILQFLKWNIKKSTRIPLHGKFPTDLFEIHIVHKTTDRINKDRSSVWDLGEIEDVNVINEAASYVKETCHCLPSRGDSIPMIWTLPHLPTGKPWNSWTKHKECRLFSPHNYLVHQHSHF